MRSLKEDKRGLSGQIMALIIMGIVLIMLILLFFIWGLLGPPLVSVTQDTNTILQDTFASSGDQNLVEAGASSFEPASQSLNNLEWLSYTLFVVLFIVWLVMCFYVRAYPFLLIIWIILIIIILAVSLYLAVVYQDIRLDPTLGTYYQSWENTDFFLKNLPAIVLVMGVIGGIIMFIIASREQDVELSGGTPL